MIDFKEGSLMKIQCYSEVNYQLSINSGTTHVI